MNTERCCSKEEAEEEEEFPYDFLTMHLLNKHFKTPTHPKVNVHYTHECSDMLKVRGPISRLQEIQFCTFRTNVKSYFQIQHPRYIHSKILIKLQFLDNTR